MPRSDYKSVERPLNQSHTQAGLHAFWFSYYEYAPARIFRMQVGREQEMLSKRVTIYELWQPGEWHAEIYYWSLTRAQRYTYTIKCEYKTCWLIIVSPSHKPRMRLFRFSPVELHSKIVNCSINTREREREKTLWWAKLILCAQNLCRQNTCRFTAMRERIVLVRVVRVFLAAEMRFTF